MAKVGILVFTKKEKERVRKAPVFFDSLGWRGFNAVVREIDRKQHAVEYISYSQVNEFDFVLVSMTSYWDILTLYAEMKKIPKRTAKIIIGGQGVVNVKSYLSCFDIAVFGRAEGQINQILDGEKQDNVLVVKDDPEVEGSYVYRQLQYLVKDEPGVGCPYNCYYCQYSWTHKQLKRTKTYKTGSGTHKMYGMSFEETFHELVIDNSPQGKIVTALDGVSERVRMAVNKRISNQDIMDKFREAFAVCNRTKFLKIYMICGYPGESPEDGYMSEFIEVMRKADPKKGKGRLLIMLHFTPFNPMPLTLMELTEPSCNHNWRDFLLPSDLKKSKCRIYDTEHISVIINPLMSGPYETFLITFFARAGRAEEVLLSNVLLNSRFKRLRAYQKLLWLRTEGHLEKIINPKEAEWSYLSAGINVAKLRGKFEEAYGKEKVQ